jgi:hypothetical protein
MLRQVNPFVRRIQEAATRDAPNLVMRICDLAHLDRRRYNLPTAAEVAVFIPDEEAMVSARPREIVLRLRPVEGETRPQLKFINEFSAVYDPLHFVLLFPRGDLGWSPEIGTRNAAGTLREIRDLRMASVAAVSRSDRDRVSLKDFMSFYLMERHEISWCSYLHLAGALFQEWTVSIRFFRSFVGFWLWCWPGCVSSAV